MRSEVLVGKTLVFSGLVPNQIKLEKSRTYLIARSLGANVTQQLTEETTHLVASTAGTFKVNAAKKLPNVHIVSPEWLWACAERWECVEERLFPLDPKKASKTRQPPAHCHSPEHVVDYNNVTIANVDDQASSSSELKFIDTINPLLTFSNDELKAMNNDVFDSDSSDDDSVDLGKHDCIELMYSDKANGMFFLQRIHQSTRHCANANARKRMRKRTGNSSIQTKKLPTIRVKTAIVAHRMRRVTKTNHHWKNFVEAKTYRPIWIWAPIMAAMRRAATIAKTTAIGI